MRARATEAVARVSGQHMLEGRGLARSFRLGGRELPVLTDVSISVKPGEFVGVVGRSGVGKSTLLHILGALDPPEAGDLLFRGQNVLTWNERRLARFRNDAIGFVFQFHHLLPEFTAVENVMMPARIAGRSEGAARSAAREILEGVGLGDRLDHRPSELSGGEQQRIAVARAIVNGPDLLLADEPWGILDPKTGEMIYDLLFDLRKTRDQTIVVTTHSMSLAARCDRVLELRNGKLHPTRP